MSRWHHRFLPQRWRNTKEQGDALEIRVANVFIRFHKWRVQKHYMLTDRFGNLSEIDVVYGLFSRRYVECKNYSNKPVPFSDVAKFKAVLELNDIPIKKGIFVTTSTFTPRCRTVGIRCIDGADLVALERRSHLFDVIYSAWNAGVIFATTAVGVDYYHNPKRYAPIVNYVKRYIPPGLR